MGGGCKEGYACGEVEEGGCHGAGGVREALEPQVSNIMVKAWMVRMI